MLSIRTGRLLLDELQETDAAGIFALRSDPEVNRYIGRPDQRSIEEAMAFVQKIRNGYLDGGTYYWAIRSKEDTRMAGTICLWNFSADRKTAELGYELLPSFQKKGIMNESVAAVIEFGWKELQLTKLEAYTHRENHASSSLLLRHGFQLEPERKDPDNADIIIFTLAPNHKL